MQVHFQQQTPDLHVLEESALIDVVLFEAKSKVVIVLFKLYLEIDLLWLLVIVNISEESRLIFQNEDVETAELQPVPWFAGSRRVSTVVLVMNFDVVFENSWRQIQIQVEKNGSEFISLDALTFINLNILIKDGLRLHIFIE